MNTSSLNNKILKKPEQHQEQPDLSHLSENERKIIEAVLERQRLEEENNLNVLSHKQHHQELEEREEVEATVKPLNNLTSTSTQSITDIAEEIKQKYSPHGLNTGDLCDICKKTKFVSNTNAHACVYCKLKCCIRCSFRLKTNTKVSSKQLK